MGKVTAQKMYRLGIYKGLDLKKKTEEELTSLFGKSGKHYYNIVRGIQHSQVTPNRLRKSIAAERTFVEDIFTHKEINEALESIAQELERRMIRNKTKGKTVTLKIKYNNFTIQTRSKTIEEYTNLKTDFHPIIIQLLNQNQLQNPVRLLGISFSNLDNKESELKWIQLKFNYPQPIKN